MENKKNNQNTNPNWIHVESALNEGTSSGYKIAVIETEKIFSQTLAEKGFPGKNILKQFVKAKHLFENTEKIERANAMFKKIITHPGFNISAEDTKDIIKNLYDAIAELEKLNRKSKGLAGFARKIGRKFSTLYQGTIKKWLFYFAFFCFAVLFMAKTSIGINLANKIIGFVEFITFKIIVPIGLILLAIYILIAGVRYFRQK